jgi:subtilisin family serine protease
MVALSRCLSVCSLLATGVNSIRFSRKSESIVNDENVGGKFIAGIPVFNYHKAHNGGKFGKSVDSLASLEQQWILVANSDATDDQLSQLCKASKLGCTSVGHPSEGGVAFVGLRGTEHDLEKLIQGSSGWKFIEPDLPVHLIPENEIDEGVTPQTPDVWGLERVGASKRPAVGSGVHIHIFDTGVRASHEQFGGRVVPILDWTTGTLVECAGAADCAPDGHGHGTHVAGTAAGVTYGVAPGATLRNVKVIDDEGDGLTSWIIGALDYVATKGSFPAVASMSLGGYGRNPSYQIAVDAAAAASVIVVVAAGNENDDACDYSPAYTYASITVGSTTSDDKRSIFSNFGRCTDIWAPGTHILSAGYISDTAAAYSDGTSMACPHVSGAAAILLEGNPNLSMQEVLQQMLDNATPNSIEGMTTGDTNKLLYVGSDGPPPAPPPTPVPPSICGEFSTGPDQWGDCVCLPGYDCWWGNYGGCPYVSTEETGYYSRFYYIPSCESCQCWPLNR